MSRNPHNELTARTGSHLSVQEQMNHLASWAQNGHFDEIVFVDDVVAFGDTSPTLVEQLRPAIPKAEFRLLVGIAASGVYGRA